MTLSVITLCTCSGPQCSNTLHFFHNQNIIKTFFSFSCKANIFLTGAAGISCRVFLTVHIIRLISILRSKVNPISIIFPSAGPFLLGTAPSSSRRRNLEARFHHQRMNRNTVGVQFPDLLQCIFKVLRRLPGRPMIRSIFIFSKPHSLARANTSLCLLYGVMAANALQCLILHCLRIYRDSLHTKFRSTISFSLVILSGLPASTVISAASFTGKLSYRHCNNSSICPADNVVGVPPPI